MRTMFIIGLACYLLSVVAIVTWILVHYRKANLPKLPPMIKDVDYFVDGPGPGPVVEATTVTFMLDDNPSKKVITVIPKKKLFVIYTTRPHPPFENLLALLTQSEMATVGYHTEDERYIFEAMAFTFSEGAVSMQKQNVSKEPPDIMCRIVEAGFFKQFDDTVNPFTIIDYEDVDTKRFSFFVPFERYQEIDFRLLMPKRDAMAHIYKCLAVDTLLYSYKHKMPHADAKSDSTIIGANSFYQLFFPFYKKVLVENYIGSVNAFEKRNIVLAINKPIRDITSLVNKYDDLKVIRIPAPDIILRMGDAVSISNQKNDSNNGYFWVTNLDKTTVTLATYQEIINFDGNFNEIERNATRVVGLSNGNNWGKRIVWFMDLDVPGTIDENGRAIAYQIRGNDDKYHCLPDNTYKTRETCESRNDPFGNPKTDFMLWDRPCENNTDCPFYVAAGNRGGCKDGGQCEMPLGVVKLGYTRYLTASNSFPYCHGCPDKSNPNCCQDQHPDPQYAYAYDYLERAGIVNASSVV